MALLLEIGFAVGLLALLGGSWLVGKRLGGQLHEELTKHPQFNVIQGAIFGLLALLLGFCFAGAIGRFVGRQEIIVREASAILTLHQRADLLPPEHAARLRRHTADYAAARLDLFALSRLDDESAVQSRLRTILDQMWAATRDGVTARPESSEVVVEAYTSVSDLLGERNGAEQRHIPGAVLIVLVVCAAASIGSVGLGVEVSDRRLRRPAMVLVFLIAATLWTTLDLDFPRTGLIRLSPQPLVDAAAIVSAGGL